MSEPQNTEILETEVEAVAIEVYQPTILNNFSAELFSEYLVPNSFDNSKDFSAYGIEHIAAQLGYSITEQEILNETDTHAFMKAKAECVQTRRSTVATASQPKMTKKHGKMVLDENYIEKLSRRVNRNALRQLIPVKLLQKMIETAIQAGEVKENEIVAIKNACSAAFIEHQGVFRSQGLDKRKCFAIAVATLGESSEWTTDDWKILKNALTDAENFRKNFKNGV